jgi:hypothetical protein
MPLIIFANELALVISYQFRLCFSLADLSITAFTYLASDGDLRGPSFVSHGRNAKVGAAMRHR